MHDLVKEILQMSIDYNARCDEINTKIEELEDALSQAGISMSAWLEDEPLQMNGKACHLGYARRDDAGWVFYVRQVEGGEVKQLLHTARAVRISAAPLLPKLVSKLADILSAHLIVATHAADTLTAFVQQIRYKNTEVTCQVSQVSQNTLEVQEMNPNCPS